MLFFGNNDQQGLINLTDFQSFFTYVNLNTFTIYIYVFALLDHNTVTYKFFVFKQLFIFHFHIWCVTAAKYHHVCVAPGCR